MIYFYIYTLHLVIYFPITFSLSFTTNSLIYYIYITAYVTSYSLYRHSTFKHYNLYKFFKLLMNLLLYVYDSLAIDINRAT